MTKTRFSLGISVLLFGLLFLNGLVLYKKLRPRKAEPFNVGIAWDYNSAHLAAAKRRGCGFIESTAKLEQLKRKGKLVEIVSCRNFLIQHLTHSSPYLVPKAKEVFQKLGAEFFETTGCRFVITSLTRTFKQQQALSGNNINAARESAHCYGTTLDISYIQFEGQARAEVNPEQILEQLLLSARDRGDVLLVKEQRQKCFHITIQ
jgi:hypothetical protein